LSILIKIIIGFVILLVISTITGIIMTLIHPTDPNAYQPVQAKQDVKSKKADELPPFDISRMSVNTPDGPVVRVTTEAERKELRKSLRGKFNIIETVPPAKEEKKTVKKKAKKQDDLKWIDDVEAYHALFDEDDTF